MKVKVGTQLEEGVYARLKVTAARARRPMSDVLEDALTRYFDQEGSGPDSPSGLRRLLDRGPLPVTPEQVRASLDEDVYDR